jgi:hypothetical protein
MSRILGVGKARSRMGLYLDLGVAYTLDIARSVRSRSYKNNKIVNPKSQTDAQCESD